jgi:hypothetical protein
MRPSGALLSTIADDMDAFGGVDVVKVLSRISGQPRDGQGKRALVLPIQPSALSLSRERSHIEGHAGAPSAWEATRPRVEFFGGSAFANLADNRRLHVS